MHFTWILNYFSWKTCIVVSNAVFLFKFAGWCHFKRKLESNNIVGMCRICFILLNGCCIWTSWINAIIWERVSTQWVLPDVWTVDTLMPQCINASISHKKAYVVLISLAVAIALFVEYLTAQMNLIILDCNEIQNDCRHGAS